MKKKLSILLLLLFVSASVSSLFAGAKGDYVGCKGEGVCRFGGAEYDYAPVIINR